MNFSTRNHSLWPHLSANCKFKLHERAPTKFFIAVWYVITKIKLLSVLTQLITPYTQIYGVSFLVYKNPFHTKTKFYIRIDFTISYIVYINSIYDKTKNYEWVIVNRINGIVSRFVKIVKYYLNIVVIRFILGSNCQRICVEPLGCFDNSPPFTSKWSRNRHLPQRRETVNTTFTLYVKEPVIHEDGRDDFMQRVYPMTFNDHPSTVWGSQFAPSLPTKIVIHGYADNGNILL